MSFRGVWRWGIAALLCPYVLTLVWTGKLNGVQYEGAGGVDQFQAADGEKRKIYLDQEEKHFVDSETFLIGMVAGQIDPMYEMEALKAQAILGRTYLYKKMDGREVLHQSELGVTLPSQEQLEQAWGKETFADGYERVKDAVKETKGQILAYEGEPVEPLFHKISAGATRTGDYPYLQSVESQRDIQADGYLTILEWETDTYGEMQMIAQDDAGYVQEIQVGGQIWSGDEAMERLQLPSPAFSIEHHEGKIRALCKGNGHGYGMSQYGAEKMAEEGYTAEDILKYYFKNTEVIQQDGV